MFPSILLLAASVIGSDYGWEPLPDGGVEYIFQFTPEELAAAKEAGELLKSEVPSHLDVHSISIRIGTGQLPRVDPPPKSDLKFPLPGQESRKPDFSPPGDPNAKSQNTIAPPLLQSPQGKPLATQASFNEQSETSKNFKDANTKTANSSAGELAKPMPLICVSIFLFLSLAGNFYLFWIYAELRKRFRSLLVNR